MNVNRGDETGQGEGAIQLGGKLAFGVGAIGEAVFLGLFSTFPNRKELG